MPIDRDATLKQAEKLLRQGRLDGAIAEYVRLAQDQPGDWNSINALGDLYVRAGQMEKAVERFLRVADYLMAEGFLPKAAALYKKALRIRRDDEPTQLRLVDIAIRQGLLVDAKTYLKQVGEQRRARGDAGGAAEIAIRLGLIDPDDAEEPVRQLLAAESAGDVLLALARRELQAGRAEEGRAALTRLLSISPDRRSDAVAVGCELAGQGRTEAAFACLNLVADLALLNHDWPGAAAALQAFTDRVTNHIDALIKLVEISVDGDLTGVMVAAQAQLADAYLADGRAIEARVIAEDLVARAPSVPANIDRFRRALVLLGAADPDAVIAEWLNGEHPDLTCNGVTSDGPADLLGSDVAGAPSTGDQVRDQADFVEAILIETIEIDLSDALSGLTAVPAAPPLRASEVPNPPRDLEAVFEDLRAQATSWSEGRIQYDAGVEHLRSNRFDQAIAAFETSARVPVMRFEAAAQLGRLHISHGDVGGGVEWLERAVQAPPPTPEEAHALLFDLAEALERLGESARALAVMIELDAEAPGYRDVAARVDRLSRLQAGS